MIDVAEAFDKVDDEFHKFDRIEDPLSPCHDLCAMMYLVKLLGITSSIIAASEHDEVYLNVDDEEFAEVATQEDVLYLTRCGVMNGENGLYMFS